MALADRLAAVLAEHGYGPEREELARQMALLAEGELEVAVVVTHDNRFVGVYVNKRVAERHRHQNSGQVCSMEQVTAL